MKNWITLPAIYYIFLMCIITLGLECVDVDERTTDSNGNTCDWYADNSLECGLFDVESPEFTASEMCCACAGGVLAPVVTTGIWHRLLANEALIS